MLIDRPWSIGRSAKVERKQPVNQVLGMKNKMIVVECGQLRSTAVDHVQL